MNVMPKRAMMTVTSADSKYSRKTDFGGPCGFVSGSGGFLCPLRVKNLVRENVRGSVVVATVVSEVFMLTELLFILSHPRYVRRKGQVSDGEPPLSLKFVSANLAAATSAALMERPSP